MAGEYEAWDAETTAAPAKKGDELYEDWQRGMVPPKVEKTAGDKALSALGTAGLMAGAGAGAYGVGKLLQWAFPGWTRPTRKALSTLDNALKKDFGGTGLKQHFNEYQTLVRDSGQPITFADYLASKSATENTRAPNTLRILNQMTDEGGQPALMAEKFAERGEHKRSRVMESLARELGVPDASVNQTLEELKAAKQGSAQALYGTAFSNRQPIRDTRLYELLSKHEPVMAGALEHAKEAFRYDPSKMVETQTRAALAGPRKDAWRFPIKAEDIPEYLAVGQPQAGLQTYISPNIETLDRMKRALWQLERKRLKEGAGDVGAIRQARQELTAMLDQIGPAEYKTARQRYAGDVALEEAAEMGANVFKQNPADFRKALLRMSPEERQALSRGFYGSLMDMNDPKFVREVISGSPKYAKQKELLSAVFPDTTALHNFLKALEAEQAMLAGERTIARQGVPASASPADNIYARTALSAVAPKTTLISRMHAPPWDPAGRVPARGSEFLFSEPDVGQGTMSHPFGGDILDYLKYGSYRQPLTDYYIPGIAASVPFFLRNLPEEDRPAGGLSSVSKPYSAP